MTVLLDDEMLFLAKHYACSRLRAIAAVDEAMEAVDDKSVLAVAGDVRRKLADMDDEMFESLAVEDWAEKNGVDIVWARNGVVGAVREN